MEPDNDLEITWPVYLGGIIIIILCLCFFTFIFTDIFPPPPRPSAALCKVEKMPYIDFEKSGNDRTIGFPHSDNFLSLEKIGVGSYQVKTSDIDTLSAEEAQFLLRTAISEFTKGEFRWEQHIPKSFERFRRKYEN